MQVQREVRVKLEGVGQGGNPTPLPETTINVVKGKSLFVDVFVGKVPTRFLVDSGAEVSIIPDTHEGISKLGCMQRPALQPVLADGSKLDVMGVVTLEVYINGQLVTADFYVVKGHIAPILGSDIMRLFSFVKLDFSGQRVSFGPRVYSQKGELDVKVPRINRVVVSSNLVVPSRQEVVVQCLVESGSPEDLESLSGQPCIFESKAR